MDSDTTRAAEPAWGSPQPEPAHWSRNKTLAAVGIAALLAAGGAAVIHAADTGSRGGPGGAPGWGPPGGPGGPGGGPGGPGGGPGTPVGNALHGVFVVADGHGGFTTELTQTGTVTEVSSTAITARSDDGFTQTYTVTTDTRQRQPVQTGQSATIRAVQSGGTNTATAISPAH